MIYKVAKAALSFYLLIVGGASSVLAANPQDASATTIDFSNSNAMNEFVDVFRSSMGASTELMGDMIYVRKGFQKCRDQYKDQHGQNLPAEDPTTEKLDECIRNVLSPSSGR